MNDDIDESIMFFIFGTGVLVLSLGSYFIGVETMIKLIMTIFSIFMGVTAILFISLLVWMYLQSGKDVLNHFLKKKVGE